MKLPNEVPGQRSVRRDSVEIIKTGLMGVGALAILGLLSFAVERLVMHFAPRDTPIVIGGGSIYGQTYGSDYEGWSRIQAGKQYSASLHANKHNPNGIDLLAFANFGKTPGITTTTGTGGWSIEVYNTGPDGQTENSTPALSFCSDINCTAYQHTCSGTFDPKHSKVYLLSRADSSLTEETTTISGKTVTYKLDFTDLGPFCPTHSDKCNTVSRVTIDTCTGDHAEYSQCKVDPTTGHQICNAQTGKP